jgi:hypothetical protein
MPWNVSVSSAITASRISVAVIPTSVRPGGSVVLGVVLVLVVVDSVVVGRGRLVVVVGRGRVVVVVAGITSVVPGTIGGLVTGVVGAVVAGATVVLVVDGSVVVGAADVVVAICTLRGSSSPEVARTVAPTPMNSASAATPATIQYCCLVTLSV